MAKDLFSDVTALVRQVMDDRDQGGGFVFGDTMLYDFGTSVQRDIFARLVRRGLEAEQAQMTRSITSADSKINWDVPAGQVLPDDFSAPEKMWEKPSGSPDTSYVPMSNASEILPDEASSDRLRYWIWQADETDPTKKGPAIKFIAPTRTVTVRILYRRTAPKIGAATDPLWVPGSYNAMAYGIMGLCAISRKRWDTAREFKNEFLEAYGLLEAAHQKGQQRRQRVRAPYRLAGVYKG
jgi:hypothetical protein